MGKQLPTNCPNCGAPVQDTVCEYCKSTLLVTVPENPPAKPWEVSNKLTFDDVHSFMEQPVKHPELIDDKLIQRSKIASRRLRFVCMGTIIVVVACFIFAPNISFPVLGIGLLIFLFCGLIRFSYYTQTATNRVRARMTVPGKKW